MNLTKILPRFIFIFGSIILFTLGFYGNQWGAVDMDDLQYRRNVNEMLVYGRLVESRSDGIFSHGGLLGLGDASDFIVEKRIIDAQSRKYMKGTGFTSYWTYKSQPGLQGIVYSTIDKWTDFAPSTNIFIYRSLISLALALILTGICYWFFLEFGWLAAIITAFFIIISKWLALLGGNLFWSLWSFYLPLLAVSFLLRSVGDKVDYILTGSFMGAVYISALIKILFSGYDFITPALLMMTVPFVYYTVKNAWGWKVFVRGLIYMGISLAGSVLTGLIILGIQIRMAEGSFALALRHIVFSFSKRTYGLSALYNEAPKPFWAEVQSVLDVIWMYLNGYAFNFSTRFSASTTFIRDIVDGRYLYIFILFALSAVLFFVKNLGTTKIDDYRKGLALIIATGYSAVAPISWAIIFRDHAASHTQLDLIIWQMPLTLFGFALVGLIISVLVRIRSN